MLWTIIVILLILWLLGAVTPIGVGIGAGGLIHVLLVVVVILIIFSLLRGRSIL